MNDDGPQPGGQGKRPWFGPKRFGYGIRPQTWQGYLVTAACVGIVILIRVRTGSSALAVIGSCRCWS